MNTNQRFPLMLELWTAFERLASRAPHSRELVAADGFDEPQCTMIYNGVPDIRNLWKTLLLRRTPHLQAVWRGPDGRAHLLAESHVAIQNRAYFCASLSLVLDRHRLVRDRARQRLRETASPGDLPVVEVSRTNARPSAVDVIRFGFRHVREKFHNQFDKVMSRNGHWGIALLSDEHSGRARTLDETSIASDAKWWLEIPSPQDRFYADPFVWLDAAGGYHLFFEDLPYATNKGVISHVMLDPVTKSWTAPPQVVLERPYHLSYPFLFEHEGDIFMIPETSGNRTIEVYRATQFPAGWVHHATMMQDIVAADTTLYHDSGTWWLFTNVAQDRGPNWDELHLYHGPSPFGPWQAHPANPIVSDCRRARMAGNIFRDAKGRLIRPAQDCEREYGAALCFCEITELSPQGYRETPVLVMDAPAERSGLHTWNKTGDVTVVDIKMNVYKRAKAQTGYYRLSWP